MSKPITANRTIGRILLALRAGRMTADVLYERFPASGGVIGMLLSEGYVTRADGYYVITPAGLQACPSRRAAPLEPMHASQSTLSRAERLAAQGASA